MINTTFSQRLQIERSEADPLIDNLSAVKEAADRYDIPVEDVTMTALNASGIQHDGTVYDRGRFRVEAPSGRIYPVALTITSNPFAPFAHTGDTVSLAGEPVLPATPMEPDTCTDTYWRGGVGRHLTLNSNSRSNCHGCTFCGTYTLDKDDSLPLNTADRLEARAEQLCEETGGDLSGMEAIGVVTGCFGNEQKLVDHLKLIRSSFAKYGFGGELQYIGSQLRDPQKLQELVDGERFALYLTVELFRRREQMMKRTKASLDLAGGRDVLAAAKDLGAATSFLYIAGLDPLDVMAEEFPRYRNVLTRLPQVQTFQAYTPNQILLRQPDAQKIDYFLAARKIIESALPDLAPNPIHNYRSLWYSTYGDRSLPDVTGFNSNSSQTAEVS